MSASDFDRRRNVWLGLTATAFLSPNFWIYAFIALPILAWASRKDTNTVAFIVLMMNIIPTDIGARIPVVGINEFFRLDGFRLVSLAVLLPASWAVIQAKGGIGRLTWLDRLLLGYGVLHIVLFIPYESFTHTMRRGFLFTIDIVLLYFVVSRTCKTKAAAVEILCSFVLACAIYAPLAVFESARGWLLYQGIGEKWDSAIPFAYLLREGSLRAQVSAGHAIPLGHMLAMGFVFWLCLRRQFAAISLTALVTTMMWGGMLAAYSRAPWLAAIVMLLVFLGMGKNGITRIALACLAAMPVAAIAVLSPGGERLIANLPFVGTVDAETIEYRFRLIEVSWELIKQNPIFGNPYVLTYLESLRTGQGIIDLINTYIRTALFYGVLTLALYVAFFLVALIRAYQLSRTTSDTEISALAAVLTASIVGFLLIMGTGGYGGGVDKLSFIIVGVIGGLTYAVDTTVRPVRPMNAHQQTLYPPRASRIFRT